MDHRRVPIAIRRQVADLVALQRRAEEGEREAALRKLIERRLVEARGRVGVAAAALGWTAAALEELLLEHPHWWPREKLGRRR